MAFDMQALEYVFLPKRITEDETPEDYNTGVAQNEAILNQNMRSMDNKMLDLETRLQALEKVR